MKNNTSVKNTTNASTLKKPYCITIENASQRTQGRHGPEAEGPSQPRNWMESDRH